ncbi:hypothetical protein HDU99_005623, partial [Rhizoclosmatium hyalinum]
ITTQDPAPKPTEPAPAPVQQPVKQDPAPAPIPVPQPAPSTSSAEKPAPVPNDNAPVQLPAPTTSSVAAIPPTATTQFSKPANNIILQQSTTGAPESTPGTTPITPISMTPPNSDFSAQVRSALEAAPR